MTAKPRRRAAAAILLAALLVLPSCLSAARAQEKIASGDRERGIALYQKGDLAGAVEALSAAVKKEKQDADAWHILGLAYYSQGDAKGARKAFETEAKLRPDSAAAHVGTAYAFLLDGKLSQAATEAERALALDAKNADAHFILGVKYFGEGASTKALGEAAEALRLSPNFAPAHLLKTQVLLGSSEWAIVYLPGETDEERDERLSAARASLETYLKLYPQTPGRALMQETLESLKSAYKLRAAPPGAVPPPVSSTEVIQKARILSRPVPQYTEMASRMGVSGTVVIRCVLGSDGRVKNISVISPLPYGLTEEAVRAARRIKFQPAVKDGRPVPQYIQMEYNFLR
jgi:TonB family protein